MCPHCCLPGPPFCPTTTRTTTQLQAHPSVVAGRESGVTAAAACVVCAASLTACTAATRLALHLNKVQTLWVSGYLIGYLLKHSSHVVWLCRHALGAARRRGEAIGATVQCTTSSVTHDCQSSTLLRMQRGKLSCLGCHMGREESAAAAHCWPAVAHDPCRQPQLSIIRVTL